MARIAGHRLLIDVAIGLIGIFMPIFWFGTFSHSLTITLLFFSGDHLSKLPFFVPAAKCFSRLGLRTSMMIGVLGYVGYFSIVYLLDTGILSSLPLMIVLLYATLILVSVFYWAPFHIDLSESMRKGRRGRQLSILRATQLGLLVLAPLAGAFLIERYGYHISFAVGLIFVLASLAPLRRLPKFEVQYEFGFWESFKKLFSRRFRFMTGSMMSYGAESVVGTSVWPIFLYVVFDGNLLEVGGFAALIVLLSLLLQLFIGQETDKVAPRKLLRIGTSIYALGWLWKGLVNTVTGVFAASTFHTFGAIIMRTPTDALMYDQAADSGHYIDEYTVLREMALTIGRVLMLLLLVIVTSVFSISTSFIIAAVVSLGINMLVDNRANVTDTK
jgi:MFS family permease